MSDLVIVIRHCKRSRSSKLDLSGRELKSLPTEIFDLKSLEELDLSNNKLDSLDEKIGNLTGLKFLDLSGNNLLSLPRSLLNLKVLTNLNVSYNPLKAEFLILSQKENQAGAALKTALADCFAGGSLSLGLQMEASTEKLTTKGLGKVGKNDPFGDDGGGLFGPSTRSGGEGFSSTSLGFYKKPVPSNDHFHLNLKNDGGSASHNGLRPLDSVSKLEELLKAEQKKVLELERKLATQKKDDFGSFDSSSTSKNKNLIEIKEGELIEKEKISQGGFSLILYGFFRGTPVAIKKIFDPNVTDDVVQEFNNELNILNRFRHPNIVQLIAASMKIPRLVIVMELFARGSLYDLIYKRRYESL